MTSSPISPFTVQDGRLNRNLRALSYRKTVLVSIGWPRFLPPGEIVRILYKSVSLMGYRLACHTVVVPRYVCPTHVDAISSVLTKLVGGLDLIRK